MQPWLALLIFAPPRDTRCRRKCEKQVLLGLDSLEAIRAGLCQAVQVLPFRWVRMNSLGESPISRLKAVLNPLADRTSPRSVQVPFRPPTSVRGPGDVWQQKVATAADSLAASFRLRGQSVLRTKTETWRLRTPASSVSTDGPFSCECHARRPQAANLEVPPAILSWSVQRDRIAKASTNMTSMSRVKTSVRPARLSRASR